MTGVLAGGPTLAFPDDDFVHRISDRPDECRLQVPFPHRAALTVLLTELDYARPYAVDKESVDAEGALFAPAAAYVEALWFSVLSYACQSTAWRAEFC